MGHPAKECPKPRDFSRVKCNNCGESLFFFPSMCSTDNSLVGHTVKRCKQPIKEDSAGGATGFDVPTGAENVSIGGDFGGFENSGGFDAAPTDVAAGGWNDAGEGNAGNWNDTAASTATPVMTGGDW